MTKDCEFAAVCGGGHTTAQHYIHVYERVIKETCGFDAFYELQRVVNGEAKNC